ncbi:heme oxygenase 1, chloroplastic-like [Rutidosis leptorrhynchoides]|uniref:heme oxygenase 1, chloroplastic-like n=1 Tax=Rutidosis leptorrhynchoides TaxID=125765 RepID=UPI003A992C59
MKFCTKSRRGPPVQSGPPVHMTFRLILTERHFFSVIPVGKLFDALDAPNAASKFDALGVSRKVDGSSRKMAVTAMATQVTVKLHSKDQSKEGEKETQGKPWPKWEPTIDGYLKFLVDGKLVSDTLDKILDQADFPECELLNRRLIDFNILVK